MQKTLAIALSAGLLLSAASAELAKAERATPPSMGLAQKAIRESWVDYSYVKIVGVAFDSCSDAGRSVVCNDVLRQLVGTSHGHKVYGLAPGTDRVKWRTVAHRQVLVDRQVQRQLTVSGVLT